MGKWTMRLRKALCRSAQGREDAKPETSDENHRLHVLRLTPHLYWPQLKDSSWPVKFDAIGGMQSQIYRLTFALDRIGVRQTVLTLRIPGAPQSWRISEYGEVRGVRVPILPLRSRVRGMIDLNPSWALGVLARLARAYPSPDVIHVHCSGVLTPPLLGLVLARSLGVPLVLTLHCSINSTYHPMHSVDALVQPLARWIERSAIRSAARTVVLTPRSIALLSSATGVSPGEFEVLPDTIDAEAFVARATPEGTEAVRKRWKLPRGRKIVGYVGRIAHEKGWPIILEIAERLRDDDVHWLICGDGNERDAFEREVETRGLGEFITVTGYVANEDIPNVMRAMDLLVMTSLHEEFGSVMLEAMAVELPIVAASVGGVANVLEDGRLGWLVSERSAPAFADGIRTMFASPQLRKNIAAQAREAVKDRYDLDEVAANTVRMYERALEANRTSMSRRR